MKIFESPELLVVTFEVEDIITTSGDPIEPTKGDTGTDIL